jgi:lipoate-protein ligase A
VLDTVTDQVRNALDVAFGASRVGSRNLLAPDESYKDFMQKIVRPVRDLLHEQGLKGFMNCGRLTPVSAMSN